MNNPFRVGTTLYLRPLERSDASTIAPWFNDPEVGRTIAMYRPVSVDAEHEFLADVYKSEYDLVLGIVPKQSDTLIGVTGLHRIDFKNRHASFGINIGRKDEWGKGYGTEATSLMVQYAFEILNLNRVWLLVYENNARGRRAYEKVGFQQEGVLRQERYHDGRYWNAFLMGILREEWKK